MTSMVARACGSTSGQMPATTVPEKGSRNKRKFRADPPLTDPNKVISLPSNECTSFEFSAEKYESRAHMSGCDMCCINHDISDTLKLDLGLGFSRHRDETEASVDEFHDADWSDFTESELEELVLMNLDTIFKSAIRKIIANGYREEVASKAILRFGLWYGCKDTVSNVVDNALAFLRSGQEIDPSKEHYFEDLQQMEKYILAELVCLLREIRPFFSTGDAMWCLLICDMNISHACAMDGDPLSSFGDASLDMNPSISAQSHSRPELKTPEYTNLVPCFHSCDGGPNRKLKSPLISNGVVQDQDSRDSKSIIVEKPFTASRLSRPTFAGERFVGSRKVSAITRREYILRHKSMHFERQYRTYGSKGASRTSRLSSLSRLVLDKKLKGVANKGVGFDITPYNVRRNLPTISTFSSAPTFSVEAIDQASLPVANTELSLSFPAESVANPMKSSNDKSLRQWAPPNGKDEMITELVPRVRELQNQLQEWTEWANQKVMQAARRLGKDKSELKTLRQEKEEVDRLKKEKLTLEENTMKKLSEMENALRKASGQVERANAAVRRLEVENTALRREMEAAKLHAAESAASCQEVSKREKKTLMKFRSWEKQKNALQDELSAEKSRLMQMQQKLKRAKDLQDQVEAKLNQEENATSELLSQVTSSRKERDQADAVAQSKEDTIKSRAETNLQKYKDDIARLEKEITQLRLKTDSSKIAALKRSVDGSYASKLTNFRDSAISYISKMATATDFTDSGRGVRRERECVMCLSEEMSVVFLPCAHQVVCTMCNELHEKQGMKDCPSCRGPILRRVSVRYAHP